MRPDPLFELGGIAGGRGGQDLGPRDPGDGDVAPEIPEDLHLAVLGILVEIGVVAGMTGGVEPVEGHGPLAQAAGAAEDGDHPADPLDRGEAAAHPSGPRAPYRPWRRKPHARNRFCAAGPPR